MFMYIVIFFLLEYTLHYKTDDGDWIQQRLGNKEVQYTLTELRCGTRYHLYMTAFNSLGTGEPSAPVFARTQGAGKKIYDIKLQNAVT